MTSKQARARQALIVKQGAQYAVNDTMKRIEEHAWICPICSQIWVEHEETDMVTCDGCREGFNIADVCPAPVD